jgi:hypothetical protein
VAAALKREQHHLSPASQKGSNSGKGGKKGPGAHLKVPHKGDGKQSGGVSSASAGSSQPQHKAPSGPPAANQHRGTPRHPHPRPKPQGSSATPTTAPTQTSTVGTAVEQAVAPVEGGTSPAPHPSTAVEVKPEQAAASPKVEFPTQFW